MYRCLLSHDDSALGERLRELLEHVVFARFTEPESENHDVEQDIVPDAVRDTISAVFSMETFSERVAGDEEICGRIAHDVVHWCADRWARIPTDDRLEAEKAELESLRSLDDPCEAARFLERRPDQTDREPATGRNETFARDRSVADAMTAFLVRARRPAQRPEARIELDAAHERLVERWGRVLRQRESRHETAFFRRVLPPFVDELNRRAEIAVETAARMRDLFGTSSGLWDLVDAEWHFDGWDSIERYADLLETDRSIERLAAQIGRSDLVASKAREPAYTEAAFETTEEISVGRSEVTGVAFGNDIETVLPIELALATIPETELVFAKKLAEGELLSRLYTTRRSVTAVRTRRERVTAESTDRGPILLCVDTSGSMAGRPETVAKTLALALCRVALAEGRACFLVAFSTRIECFELSDLGSAIPELSRFLGGTFHGGTDLRPAVARCIDLLETERYRTADVVVVSDFRIPKVLDRASPDIRRVQSELGTRLHAVTVNDMPVDDPYNIFDYHYRYAPGSGVVEA